MHSGPPDFLQRFRHTPQQRHDSPRKHDHQLRAAQQRQHRQHPREDRLSNRQKQYLERSLFFREQQRNGFGPIATADEMATTDSYSPTSRRFGLGLGSGPPMDQ